GAGLQATNNAQPRGDRLMQQRGLARKRDVLLQREPDVRRIALQHFAEESRWRHANDREGVPLDDKCRAHNGRVAAIGGLPGAMTEYRDRRCGRRVVFRSEDATAESADTQRRKVVAGDIFRAERAGCGFHTLAANAHPPPPGLEGSELLEFGHFLGEALYQRIGEHAPFVLGTALDAAVVASADAVKA